MKGEKKTIRSFVAVSIAKVIRKLPVSSFSLHLRKLVNLIVVKGLRERDINTREKARKALLKVVFEVSPRFLFLIFKELHDGLTRGYQLHVLLYTVQYVLNHLNSDEAGENRLRPGQVTPNMLSIMSTLLLREMFGDLMRDQTRDTKKKHIKESKAHKAMSIFEVFAQYSNFKTSFLELI